MPNLMKCHDTALKNGHFLHGTPKNGFVNSCSIKTSSELQLFLGKTKQTKQKDTNPDFVD